MSYSGEFLKAVQANDLIKVNELLADVKDVEKLFALVQASQNGFLEIVKVLIQTGIDLNWETPLARQNALREAAWEGHTEIVRVLLEAGVDATLPPENPRDSTALLLAAGNGHFDVVKLLVEAGVNVNEVKAREADYALLAAAMAGYENIFNYLAPLTDTKLYQKALNDSGTTPLFWAVLKKSVSLVQFLVKAGANPDKGEEIEGTTPLMALAVALGPWTQESIIILSLLLDAGADTNVRDLEEGQTALMYFVNSSTRSETEEAIRRQAVEMLLKSGADVNVKDNFGRSALDFAQDQDKDNEDLELEHFIKSVAESSI